MLKYFFKVGWLLKSYCLFFKINIYFYTKVVGNVTKICYSKSSSEVFHNIVYLEVIISAK